ncbi:SecDF P1 head subdomain-containing protein [Merismopedia glauca]|uniref:SecDF P1 head subdomain domain-containing protein n=1 Tax=Merismopedia glauca CCAP 1448/3 TaxID=1296344 RepID=A0A2T1BZN5_9CYAN|nr:hypothetical protein [Merismopedia glauca]PSB01452.1 hypothetical protein C7B64_18165 [Merismopedia glauca CCAP 1448/3]
MLRHRKHNLFMVSLAIVLGLSACTPAQTLPANRVTPNDQTVTPESKAIVEFRVQKPGTESKFASQNQVLQQLLVEQKELEKKGDRNAIKKNQASIERINKEISSLFETAKLDDRDITQASPQAVDRSWQIAITFTEEGGQKFARMTKELAGTGRSLGIFHLGQLISSPVVSSQFYKTGITGGAAVIEGNFTAKEVRYLVDQLNHKASLTSVGKSQYLVSLGIEKAEKKDFAGAINNFDEAIRPLA